MFFIGVFGITEKEAGSARAQDARCSYCGQTGTQVVTVYTRHFHFFWIPLFRVGRRAFAECSHCRRMLRDEEFDTALQQVASGLG